MEAAISPMGGYVATGSDGEVANMFVYEREGAIEGVAGIVNTTPRLPELVPGLKHAHRYWNDDLKCARFSL